MVKIKTVVFILYIYIYIYIVSSTGINKAIIHYYAYHICIFSALVAFGIGVPQQYLRVPSNMWQGSEKHRWIKMGQYYHSPVFGF